MKIFYLKMSGTWGKRWERKLRLLTVIFLQRSQFNWIISITEEKRTSCIFPLFSVAKKSNSFRLVCSLVFLEQLFEKVKAAVGCVGLCICPQWTSSELITIIKSKCQEECQVHLCLPPCVMLWETKSGAFSSCWFANSRLGSAGGTSFPLETLH